MKDFSQFMQSSQAQIANRNYSKALQLLDQAEAVLKEKSNEINLPEWAYVFDYKRYCLYELGKKEQAMEVCLQIIQKLNSSADWPYLEEYNVVRSAKRSAYNLLAWETQIKAQNEAEIQAAINYIQQCFETLSPIEDRSVFNFFYDTRALVFLKASTFNPQKYQLLFFQSLEELEKGGIACDDKSLKEWLQNPTYLEYKNNNPLDQIKQRQPHETWREALDRYLKILESKKPLMDDFAITINQITFKEKEEPARLHEFEQKYNCLIAEELKKLYLETGAFSIKNSEQWGSIEIYSNKNSKYSMPNIGGLVEMIDQLWGGRPEFKKAFTADQIKFLNENYFIFGHYFYDDNSYDHFYFDRQRKFGSLAYDQDDFRSAYKDYFQPLLQSSLATMTFDELISSHINLAIDSLLEQT